MRSLNARVTLGAGLVLAVFIVLSALALERAFRESARSAREERLLAQIYLLMAAAEVDGSGDLRISATSLEPRLDLPDSGLYATIVDGDGKLVWQSRSGQSVDLPAITVLTAGNQSFAQTVHAGHAYLAKTYGVSWATGQASYPFTFAVTEDARAYDEQLAIYRRSLWTSLGVMGLFLLAAQWLSLRWGLRPLRHVADELNRLEAGQQQSIGGHYPHEVQRLVDNLNSVLNHERKQQQRYRNALSDLAHSLKTPLALMRGTAREGTANSIQAIEQQVDQMDRIVGYHLQRAAASGRSAMAASLGMRSSVERMIAAMKKVYSDKNPRFQVDIADDLLFRGDEGDLTELLGNLLDNACKWCRHTIRVSARIRDAQLHIVVEDDGPGIADADAARVLDRGMRADETKPGHGIGLAVVREIAGAYGGGISVGTSALGGACVTVTLPQDA